MDKIFLNFYQTEIRPKLARASRCFMAVPLLRPQTYIYLSFLYAQFKNAAKGLSSSTGG